MVMSALMVARAPATGYVVCKRCNLLWTTTHVVLTITHHQDNELLGSVGNQMREWVSTLSNTISELPRSLSDNISYLSTNLIQYASDLGAGNIRLPSFNSLPIAGHRDEDAHGDDRYGVVCAWGIVELHVVCHVLGCSWCCVGATLGSSSR